MQAVLSKLSLATYFRFEPGDAVSVYQERDRRWRRRVKVLRTGEKEVVVNDVIKTKTYGLSQLIRSVAAPKDQDLRGLLSGLENNIQRYIPRELFTEKLEPSDPRARSDEIKASMGRETEVFRKHGFSEKVNIKVVPTDANTLSSRFALTLKDAGTPMLHHNA